MEADKKKECAVQYCEGRDELLPVCRNSHFMHVECVRNLARSSERGKLTCPLCRDDTLSKFQEALTTVAREEPQTPPQRIRIINSGRVSHMRQYPDDMPKAHPSFRSRQ